jgi:hypothetical protein
MCFSLCIGAFVRAFFFVFGCRFRVLEALEINRRVFGLFIFFSFLIFVVFVVFVYHCTRFTLISLISSYFLLNCENTIITVSATVRLIQFSLYMASGFLDSVFAANSP